MKKYYLFLVIVFVVGCFSQIDSYYVIPTQIGQIPADPMNPITESKVLAGEYFFHSTAISEDGRTSCRSCHNPQKGFTSGQADFPGGCGQGCILVNGKAVLDPNYVGKIDSMNFVKSYGAGGAAYQPVMGRAGRFGMTKENEACQTDILKHFGLDSFPNCEATLFQAFVALKGHRQLLSKRLFEDKLSMNHLQHAFPSVKLDSVSTDSLTLLIGMTLDAFQRVAGLEDAQKSRFQSVVSGKGLFTAQENQGYLLFKQHCVSCHSNPVMGGGPKK